MSEPAVPDATAGPGWRAQAAIGIALFLIGVIVWHDAQRLPAPSAVGVGPSAAMRLIAVLVVIIAAAHWISAWRLRARVLARQGVDPVIAYGNRASLAWVLGALVGLIVIIELGGGFVLASTWLFAGTARGFGQRLSLKPLVVGGVLATVVYLFFTKGLSLALPAGPLERLFG